MSDDVLLVEQREHIATMTINRPEKRNALNPEIHAGMVEHIDRMSEEGEVRCLVIRGQGELAFSAGDDLLRAPGDPGPQPNPSKDPMQQWPHRREDFKYSSHHRLPQLFATGRDVMTHRHSVLHKPVQCGQGGVS